MSPGAASNPSHSEKTPYERGSYAVGRRPDPESNECGGHPRHPGLKLGETHARIHTNCPTRMHGGWETQSKIGQRLKHTYFNNKHMGM